jgi:hypothetical protein
MRLVACPVWRTIRATRRPDADSQINRIVTNEQAGSKPMVTVETITLDSFLEAHGWPGIGLLKIDTEGFDLHVLGTAVIRTSPLRLDTASGTGRRSRRIRSAILDNDYHLWFCVHRRMRRSRSSSAFFVVRSSLTAIRIRSTVALCRVRKASRWP